MSQQSDGFNKTFRVDGTAAIAQYARVKLTSGYLVAAGANEADLGTLNEHVFNDSVVRDVSVRLKTCPGTCQMIAAGAISQYAEVFGAASGKINDVVSHRRIGIALEAASGNASVIEILRTEKTDEPPPMHVTLTGTATTLTRDMRNGTFSNTGLGAAHTCTLPQDAVAGDTFHFSVSAAQELRVDPGAAGAIYINGAKQSDDAYITADDEAEHVTLTADGNGDWIAGPYNGTWTVV
jgi:hypothetical protein